MRFGSRWGIEETQHGQGFQRARTVGLILGRIVARAKSDRGKFTTETQRQGEKESGKNPLNPKSCLASVSL
jgi:hypothetical protein